MYPRVYYSDMFYSFYPITFSLQNCGLLSLTTCIEIPYLLKRSRITIMVASLVVLCMGNISDQRGYIIYGRGQKGASPRPLLSMISYKWTRPLITSRIAGGIV